MTTSDGFCVHCTVTSPVTKRGELAATGSDIPAKGAGGVGLVAIGAMLILAGRRRVGRGRVRLAPSS